MKRERREPFWREALSSLDDGSPRSGSLVVSSVTPLLCYIHTSIAFRRGPCLPLVPQSVPRCGHETAERGS